MRSVDRANLFAGEAMKMFIVGCFSLVLLIGCCARCIKTVKQPTVSKEQAATNDAASTVHDIEAALKSYIEDEGMARLERKEIATVQADLAVVHLETDEHKFTAEVDKLQVDWDALVALDELLQRENRA